jgi:type I restriction enzyme S subunit
MPKNWKTYKLAELAQLRKEGIKPSEFNGEKYIGLEHIGQGNFLLDAIGKASDVTSNKSKFVQGDILYGKIRPYFKKVYRPKFSGICSTDILIINSSNEELVTQNYLHQIIKTQEFTDKATETSTGTKMPRADWKSLERVDFEIPPLPEQKAIANILSAIDDKIENNLAINKTLKDMAMALYKHWFVDFGPFQDGEFIDSELGPIPKGWEVDVLGNHVIADRGLSYKGKFLSEYGVGVPMHNLNSIYEGGYYKHSGLKWYSGDYKERHIVKPGDLIIANTEQGFEYKLIGSAALIPKKYGSLGIFSHHLYKLTPKDSSNLSKNYIYYKLLDSNYRYYVTAYANGTTVNMMPKDGLIFPKIVIPSSESVYLFDQKTASIHSKIEENLEENGKLKNLRDTLLPKLISGEMRLKEFQNQIETVL